MRACTRFPADYSADSAIFFDKDQIIKLIFLWIVIFLRKKIQVEVL